MSNEDKNKGERIAKVMARAGLCSRREAERWIEARRVSVNGRTLDSAACVVTSKDEILVDKKPLPMREKTRLFLYHKPAGLVSTNNDEQGRQTIFDKMPKDLPRVMTVGRLDINTEGLLLLTNDGELSRYLELPINEFKRTYRVRVLGKVRQEKLDILKKGIKWDGVKYGPIDAVLDENSNEKSQANNWIEITLQEGKNREVRNVLEAINLQVNRLIRVSYGPFHLGKLPKKAIMEVKPSMLKSQLDGYFD